MASPADRSCPGAGSDRRPCRSSAGPSGGSGPGVPLSLDAGAVRGVVTAENAPGGDGVASRLAPVLYLGGWLAGALPAFAMITILWLFPGPFTPFGIVGLGAYALAFPVMVRRLRVPRTPEFLVYLVVAGVAFAVVSILTGWANGLTDEGFTTPRFAAFVLAGHDPYTTPLTFSYVAYGQRFTSSSFYVYLPLLMFLQVPGLAYKWFALACWVAIVFLVRRRPDTAVLLAQPYVLLVAANGYNDLAVLLLLTVAFVGVEGRRPKWVEWLALGCKQFANVFVLAYYAVRRDWRNLVVTAAVSGAFVVPFLLWGGTAVLCPMVLANRLPSCPHTGGVQLLINYPVWVVWVVAVFYGAALAQVARRTPWRAPTRRAPEAPAAVPFERWPSLVVVALTSVFTGLGLFVVLVSRFGTGAAELEGAGAAAGFAAVAWSLAWGGPWSFETLSGAPRRAGIGRLAASLLLTVVVELGVLGAALVVHAPAVLSGACGLVLGVAASCFALAVTDLPAPLARDPRPPQKLDRTPSARGTGP